MRRTLARLAPFAALALLAVTHASAPRSARADAKDPASAQALFDEALRLASSGKYERACPKYEASQRLDPALGTAFNLADCYEHVGKTASAWALYLEVESGAKSAGKHAREVAAHERAVALEPRLSRLTILVPQEARIAGLVVTRDGTSVASGAWGEALPLDPGAHVVDANAPGKKTWHASVAIAAEGTRVSVTVPVLDDVATSVASATTAAPRASADASPSDALPPSEGSAQRTWALVVGGVGVVGVGVGAAFGAISLSKHDDAAKTCATPNPCSDRQAATTWSDATSAGTVSTIALGVGAAALVGGLVLWLTAQSSPSRVQVAPTSGGLVVRGQW